MQQQIQQEEIDDQGKSGLKECINLLARRVRNEVLSLTSEDTKIAKAKLEDLEDTQNKIKDFLSSNSTDVELKEAMERLQNELPSIRMFLEETKIAFKEMKSEIETMSKSIEELQAELRNLKTEIGISETEFRVSRLNIGSSPKRNQ
ncbi:hypothetical protein CLIB1444_12S02674 [[Candida] jaroonii]|uniref:Uncharacterized protein n=1 Tax=[Candida] jaroonii TaxID=467808 RepID=A0ACA9YE54_9ASCO|nr:hypothetical protein CLIB1444_12S02674 [[Candida] jaroonii]